MPDYTDYQQTEDQSTNENTLRIENEVLRKGFTLIPNAVLRARNVSRDAKLLYGILLSYAWQKGSCFPGYEILMDDMQCAREALAKYIKELKESGLVEVQRRGQGKTSIYTIRDPRDGNFLKFENRTSRSSETEQQEVRKSNGEEYTKKNTQKEEYPSNIRKTSHGKKSDQTVTDDTDTLDADGQGSGTTQVTSNIRFSSPGLEQVGDTLKRRQPKKLTRDEDSLTIQAYLEDFSRELGDQAPLKSTTTRAVNLYRESGIELERFIPYLFEAKAITQEKSGSIKKRRGGADSMLSPKAKVPYFFGVLEDLLGLKEGDSDQPSTHSAP